MCLKIHLKALTILGILIGLLLVGFFLSLYNNKKDVVEAQVAGEILWKCGEEIVIGEVVVEASQVANNITNAFNEVTKASSEQITLADQIYQSPLPEECKAENCNTGCTPKQEVVCVDVPKEVCEEVCDTVCNTVERCRSSLAECENDRPDWALTDCEANLKEVICPPEPGPCLEVWEWCWDEEICDTFCHDECKEVPEEICDVFFFECGSIKDCTGDACPVDELIKDVENANRIASLYTDIEAATNIIKSEVGKRDAIIDKLNKAREQLALCVTPASGYTPEEWELKQKSLLPCDLAKRLSPDVEECSNENNFFCCTPIFY